MITGADYSSMISQYGNQWEDVEKLSQIQHHLKKRRRIQKKKKVVKKREVAAAS